MSAGRFEVEGRVFYNRIDYEAALRDYEKIKEIKATYDLKNAEDIRQVYSYLAGGSYRFESAVGDDFDDEIFKLYSDIKDKPQKENGKKQRQKTKGKSIKTANSKKKISLDDCDDELKEAVKAEMKKQERRRRLMILAFSLVAVACFTYFGIYYYQNYRTGNDMQHLAQIKEQNKTPGLAHLTDDKEEDSTENAEETAPEVLEDYKTLLNMNKDLIGWLKIADINIDHPVMQANHGIVFIDPAHFHSFAISYGDFHS